MTCSSEMGYSLVPGRAGPGYKARWDTTFHLISWPSQEAQKMVDFILRHGNDLLAIECLTGFHVSQHVSCW